MRKIFTKFSVAVFTVLVLFLLSTTVLPVAPVQADSQPECWGVFVGVSNYQSANDLTYCDDDAEDISEELSSVWGSNHIRVLIDSQATRAGILNALDWLAANADANDTVLFTFSGHGMSGGYLCPYDTSPYSYAYDISDTELADALNAIPANKQIVVLDICHAGAFRSALTRSGRVVLMACASSELSMESWSLQNGVYSYYIIKALSQFDTTDTNNDYELSAEEIAQYANPLANYWNDSQTPVLYDGYTGQLALLAKFIFDINLSLPYGANVLTLDGTTYSSIPAPMLWVPGVSHTVSVPQLVDSGTGTRYVFTQWSDGTTTVTRIVTKGSYTANYLIERMLEVISAYGQTQGGGWYEDGTAATFSVTDYVELPDTRHYFTGWSGDYFGDSATASIIMDAPQTVTANWRHEYLLTLNSDYGTLTGAGWYREGEMADISVTDYVELPDTKHYFTGWSGDYTGDTASASLSMTKPKVVDANWRHEYLLTLNSEYGESTGAGWYREGKTATVSVEPVQGIIVRHIFDGWSGDLTDTEADSSVTMNSPKVITATWRTDFVQLYILIGGVVVLGAAIVITVILVRRRRAV